MLGFCYAAEDWLKPCVLLEAFEARALRLAVACAQNISKAPNLEEGTLFSVDYFLKIYIIHDSFMPHFFLIFFYWK